MAIRSVQRFLVSGIAASVLVVSGGCIVDAPTKPKEGGAAQQQQQVQQQAASVKPLQARVGANMGNKVEIQGAVVDPGQVMPGQPAKVTIYFKVLDTIPEDWMVFVHVEDVDGRMERLNVDHKPAGGQYPTNQWKKGEVVQDTFQIYLPPGSSPRGLNVLMGLWNPANDQRMKLMNPEQVRNDGKDRILLVQVPVAQL